MPKRDVEDFEIVEPEREAPAPEPVVPPAMLVFDLRQAIMWLADANRRLRNAYDSVRFEPLNFDPKRLPFLLKLAAQSVRGHYTVGWERHPARGVFYVPSFLADHEMLAEMERGETIGDYVAFRHP